MSQDVMFSPMLWLLASSLLQYAVILILFLIIIIKFEFSVKYTFSVVK